MSALAAAGVTAGASLVGGMLQARQQRRHMALQRKLELEKEARAREMDVASLESQRGQKQQAALSSIIENIRASLR